jgi:single-strand DNA-binding protein
MHQIMILGNLGRDAEMRYISDGTPVVNFSIASNRAWKSDGEWQNETTWFRVSCFGKMYENRAEKLTKGTQVLVIGRMSPDKDTGGPQIYNDRASYDVRCLQLRITGQPGGGGSSASSSSYDDDGGSDDIPF